jgi:hypothetical protein
VQQARQAQQVQQAQQAQQMQRVAFESGSLPAAYSQPGLSGQYQGSTAAQGAAGNALLSWLQQALQGTASGAGTTGSSSPNLIIAAIQEALSSGSSSSGVRSGQQGLSPLSVLQAAISGSSSGSGAAVLNSLLAAAQQGAGVYSLGSSSGSSSPVLSLLQGALLGGQQAGSNPMLSALQQGVLGGSGMLQGLSGYSHMRLAGEHSAEKHSDSSDESGRRSGSGDSDTSGGSEGHGSSGRRGLLSTNFRMPWSKQGAVAPTAARAAAPSGQYILEQGSFGGQQQQQQQLPSQPQQWLQQPQQLLRQPQQLLQQPQQWLQPQPQQQQLLGQLGSVVQQGLQGQQGLSGQQGLLRQPLGNVGQLATNLQQGLLGPQQGMQAQQQQQQQPQPQPQPQPQQQQQQQQQPVFRPHEKYWKAKAVTHISNGLQNNLDLSTHQIHELKHVVKPVKQTAVDTTHSILYDGKRAIREAKRVDNSIKGQLVDTVANSMNQLRPITTLKQAINKTALIEPFADAAQAVMKQKAQFVRDIANDIADTDIEIGGELEVVTGSLSNLTRNGMFNLTGASKNLAQAVTGGATNFFNETRNAPRQFAQMIPQLINTTTQSALNGITATAPLILNLANQTQRVANMASEFPRDIGGDVGKLVSAGIGAVPGLATSLGTGALSVLPTMVPWVSRGVDLAAQTGVTAARATGSLMHNLAAPLATGALQSAGSLGTNLLTTGFNQGFNEGLLASLERRTPFQDGSREAGRLADQPALFLPNSFSPLGQTMTVTYPCPTGSFPGPAVPPLPVAPTVPGQPPQVPGAGGPPTAPVGTIIGPGIPCGVPLHMVPKSAVPRQGRPLPAPLVEYPLNPVVSVTTGNLSCACSSCDQTLTIMPYHSHCRCTCYVQHTRLTLPSQSIPLVVFAHTAGSTAAVPCRPD